MSWRRRGFDVEVYRLCHSALFAMSANQVFDIYQVCRTVHYFCSIGKSGLDLFFLKLICCCFGIEIVSF